MHHIHKSDNVICFDSSSVTVNGNAQYPDGDSRAGERAPLFQSKKNKTVTKKNGCDNTAAILCSHGGMQKY